MKVLTLVACAALAALPGTAAAVVPVQRFMLVIGANSGGADRPALHYAVSDAERFARVMLDLGGVSPANQVVLRQPRLKELVDAFDALTARVTAARRNPGAGRTEVIVYYSGHADDQGLLLGEDKYSYQKLRDRLDQMPADVRIAVLDACASGAFTRAKGGKARPAFLVDESADMRGHVFLTSSAEAESAQESDRIQASYFTHYLISGFRGAADLSGDGKVTLNEAYQFAFNETLGRTVDTRGGAQHPSYDINLSGAGDVVMTDVRQTTATLVLGENLDGRFFVRNGAQELVVELYKPFGRTVELGLEPGAYDVRLDREKVSMLAKARVDEGARFTLEAKQFGPVALEATRRRGGLAAGNPFAVAGRNRIEFRAGTWRHGSAESISVSAQRNFVTEVENSFGAVQYTRYLTEQLAATFAVSVIGGTFEASTGAESASAVDFHVWALPIGVRWNPVHRQLATPAIKPYIAASAGPFYGISDASLISGSTMGTQIRGQSTIGGHVGGGIDVHVARFVSIGVNAGYNWMADFERPIGSRDNFGGPEIGVAFGLLFGKGSR